MSATWAGIRVFWVCYNEPMLAIIYRPHSEHARAVEEFQHLLDKRHIDYELVDADSRSGAAKMETYGIMRYPTVLATTRDGQMLKMWHGVIPTVADVEYYARGSL